MLEIVRFAAEGWRKAETGVLCDSHVATFGCESLSHLLRLPLDELRAKCVTPGNRGYARGSVRLLPPVDGGMEIWAAGVTYRASQVERMKESQSAASIYDLVYAAARPELFYKASAWQVVGDGEPIAIRADSAVNVPEPELAVVINAGGEIIGFTICNDVSSRTIEGQNPLYLPQAKVYLGSCAIGPSIRPVWEIADPYDLGIRMMIRRQGDCVWDGMASTRQLRRRFDELISYLTHACVFPDGAVLSTGTCLVPELPFSLAEGDAVDIAIDQIGRLSNGVVRGMAGVEWLVAARDDVQLRASSP